MTTPRNSVNAGTGDTPFQPPLPPPLPNDADDTVENGMQTQPQNVFVNDGNFMAQFLANQQRTNELQQKKKDDKPNVVTVAEQDDRVRQSVVKNDGSFMATFLALQHKEERQARQRKEAEELTPQPKLPLSSASVVTADDAGRKQVEPPSKYPTASTKALLDAAGKPRARKRSRWDNGPSENLVVCKQQQDLSADEGESIGVDEDEDKSIDVIRAKQQKHRQEIDFLEQRIRGFQQRAQLAAEYGNENVNSTVLSDERRHEYLRLATLDDKDAEYKDTIEDAELGRIEGGTLEHRKRAREMLVTLQSAETLTVQAEGKHHLGDFLPQTELEKFMKEAKTLAGGENQMLIPKHAEQASLGSTRGRNPIRGTGSGAGIGVRSSSELDENDDEFDQYRKRMMLAYRFRPNPLNNPRRPYN